VVNLVGGAAPRLVLAILFVITAVLGLFISNTATAVLMAPVALAIAKDFGASPHPFAMIVALAASAAFMTPISSPVNTLVVGPGQYSFSDFVKVGVPFTVIVAAVSVLLVPIFSATPLKKRYNEDDKVIFERPLACLTTSDRVMMDVNTCRNPRGEMQTISSDGC
jgi:di/tricarboxylate transporter